MNQIVIKDNIYIPHPNHSQDEGRRGRIPKPSHYIITSNKNKRLTTVVPATRSARAIDGGEDRNET